MAKLLLALCLAWAGLSRASGMRMVKRRQQHEGNEVSASSSIEDVKVEDGGLPVLEDLPVSEEEDWPVLEEVEASQTSGDRRRRRRHLPVSEEEDWPVLEEVEASQTSGDRRRRHLPVSEEEEDWPVLEEVEASQTSGDRRRRRRRDKSPSPGSPGPSPSPFTCPYGTGGGLVQWAAFGGVNEGNGPMQVNSRAAAGDHEFVAIGGSNGGSQDNPNKPWNEGIMTKEGFKLIVIRGTQDKLAELWYRKSNGGGNIFIPGKAKDNPYTIFAVKGNLEMNDVKTASMHTSGSREAKLKNPGGSGPGGSGLTIGVFFFDDAFKLNDAPNGGDILCRNWGYGDSDGFAVVLYQPGKTPPSKFSITKMDSGGGSQYVSITAVIPVR